MTAEILDRRLHGVAIYNPDLLSKEELVAQFVARRGLLEQLSSDLRRPGFNQHQLIVGSRGMGKTTLLRRLRYAIEDDAELSAIWLPLTFPEEQYNVGRLSDLYLNFVDALGDALEQQGRRDDAAAIDDARDALPRENEERRAAAAVELLLGVAKRIERRLLLLVDNLDLVLERLEKNPSAQWAFRELLSAEDRILLIGAMPVMVGATYEYGAPFYEFFQIHELRGLSREEMREVLTRLAQEMDAPAVEQLLRTDPARIDTLHTLTAGNPRTLVLLFNVLAQGTEGDVRSDLEKLLDQCTPLYKSRFEALPAQAQQIVDAVAIHWDPISAGELAEKLPLDVNAVSSQLNRLVMQGVLEKVEYYPETKTGFQVAERFFNIWYLMRASRRVRRRLIWLVQFLRLFYGAEQVKTKAHHLLQIALQGSRTEKLRHAEFCLAIAELIEDDWPTRSALESRAIRTLLTDSQLSSEMAAMFDLDGADASLRPVVDRERWVEEINRVIDESKMPEKAKERARELVVGLNYTREERLMLARALRNSKPARRKELLSAAESYRQAMIADYGPSLALMLRKALALGYLDSVLDAEGAAVASAVLNAPELEAPAAYQAGDELHLRRLLPASSSAYVRAALADVLLQSKRIDEALQYAKEAVSHESFGYAEFVLGKAYGTRGMLADANAALERSAVLHPAQVNTWILLGYGYLATGDVDRGINALERALALERSPRVLRDYGRALRAAGRYEEAIEVLRESLEKESSADTQYELADALLNARRFEETLNILEAAVPADITMNLLRAAALIGLGRSDEAFPILDQVAHGAPDPAIKLRVVTSMLLAGAADTALSRLSQLVDDSTGTLLLPEFIEVASAAVRAGQARPLRAILQSRGAEDAVRPLYEALSVVDSGEPGLLMRLAPEIKEPTARLLESWGALEKKRDRKKARPQSRRRR